MRRLVFLAALALAAACGDNSGETPKDAGPPDASTPDADPGVLAPCLERPTDLAKPPTGPLPCELLPPGFAPPK